MSFHYDARIYLLKIKDIINADAKDVPLGRQQQLELYSSLKILLIKLLLKGCPSIRCYRTMERLIKQRLISGLCVVQHR